METGDLISQSGQTPVGNASADTLKNFDAFYVGDTSKPVIYLTFDAGYENGCTPAILEALKKHHVPATFFVVGNYLETSPELVKQMIAEGHTVANHTRITIPICPAFPTKQHLKRS